MYDLLKEENRPPPKDEEEENKPLKDEEKTTSLSSVYKSCLYPCHSACKDTGKTVFVCERECEDECTGKAYGESNLKNKGRPSKQFPDEEKELFAFKKKQLEDFMDMHCKNKQCKDDDKQCKADDCGRMYELLRKG
ncbi:PREDICTED: uncharacterized protein LOC109191230 [Ipomoea nil]|uniref:uncharacterized protein LOC109191230 n=1 Tax=Ipomoea nil TaxID=35883 RepID=UPI000901EE84|nr:PREDICTED: uncharacterized protein LOC109191230 [Ipomoea nil]